MERTKSEYLQAVFGTTDIFKAQEIDHRGLNEARHYGSIKLPLPYEAPNHPPLPSLKEIEHAIYANSLRAELGEFPICRVGPCVVKCAHDTRILQEAENLLYLEKHAKVRVPKLYAVYQIWVESGAGYLRACSVGSPNGRLQNFMVTEFLDGDAMSADKFDSMSKIDQDIILQRLGEQIQLLRSVQPEGDGYYGRIDYQGWSRLTTFVRSMKPGFRGPYNDDFLAALLEAFEFRFTVSHFEPEWLPRLIEHYAQLKRCLGASTEIKPVLTHFDLKWENIMVWRMERNTDEKANDWEVALLDWDHAGWAPAYMQKASLLERIAVPQEIREREDFCGFGKDEYKAEAVVLAWDDQSFPLL